MSDEDKTDLNTDGLDKLMKALKDVPVVHVGILGGGERTSQNGQQSLTNASVGAIAEFGTSKTPVRSWLRVPLIEHLDKRLQESGILKQAALKDIIKTGSFVQVMAKVGIISEAIIADGFDSGGFGKWPPSKMSGKKNHQTLVETQQLRNSVTSEVQDKGGK